MDAMKNQTTLDNYSIEFESILDENELRHKPGQIYNMDELGVPLDHRSLCALARKGQKKSGIVPLGTNLRLLLLDA